MDAAMPQGRMEGRGRRALVAPDASGAVRRPVTVLVVFAMTLSLLVVPPPGSALAEGPNQLAFTTNPAGAEGATPFSTQPVVTVQDAEGVTVDTAVEVTLTLAGGTAGATLTCAPVTTTSGVATFSGCSVDTVGTDYTLHAVADGVDAADSQPFDVVAGPPSQLVVTIQPTDIQAGSAFDPAPAIELRDAGGNPAVADGYSLGMIAATSTDAPQPLTGCLDGSEVTDQGATFFRATLPEGATGATFDGCGVDRAATDYTLLAVAVPNDPAQDVLVAYSDAFDVGTGQPAGLVFHQQPGGWLPASDVHAPLLERQPIVALVDALGNVVAEASPHISLAISDDDVTLECEDGTTWPPPRNTTQAENGVAEFEECRISPYRTTFQDSGIRTGSYTITAWTGSLSVESMPFGMVLGGADGLAAADALQFQTQPGSSTGGLPVDPQPVVQIVDADGAPVPGVVDLTLVDDQGATLRCSSPLAPAPFGTATFYGCAVDVAGTYALQATDMDSGITATSEYFDVTPGAPVGARFAASPSEALAGTPFDAAVELLDAGGNVVTTSGDDVRLALAAGPGTRRASLDCDAGPVASTVDGSAEFASCTIDRPGAYRLVATTAYGVALSEEFLVLVGPPATVTFLSAPAAAIDGGLLATPRVLVEDAGGNAVDASVALTAAGGELTDCVRIATAAHGIAAFPACTLAASADTLVLTATAGAATELVEVPVTQDEPVGGSDVAVPLAQTFGGATYGSNPTATINDVNQVTGALAFSSEDLTVAGIGIPFVLTRTYNSADSTGGVFGPGWSSLFDAGVTIASDGTATVRGDDGQQIVFEVAACKGSGANKGKGKKKGNCGWIAPAGAAVSLSCHHATCTVERHDGVAITSEDGRVSSVLARNGQGLHIDRDRHGAVAGVRLTTSGAPLVVDVTMVDGLVTQVATPTRTLTYAYADGLLTGYTDATGNTTTYAYADDRLVERALGGERLLASYGDDGRVESAATTGNQRRYADTYAWSVDGTTGVVTTARTTATTVHGVETTATYRTHHRGNVVRMEQWPDGATLAYSFGEDGNLIALQDALGNVQRMTYNAAGDLIQQVAADGGVTSLAYDDEHRVTFATDALGNTTEYQYADDELRWIVPPDPTDPTNQPGPRGEVGTRFDYDGLGQLVQVTTPLSVRTISRDVYGNETGHQVHARDDVELTTPLNGMGPLLRHDEAGNVVSQVDPRGHLEGGDVDPAFETINTYDPNGRLLETVAPNGDVTSTTYTPSGETASLTMPGTGTTTYAWDEATRTRTATGASPGSWVFDPAGNLRSRTTASGATTTWTHDEVGLTATETDPSGVTTHQLRDAMSSVVRIDDAAGRVEMAYEFNRAVRTTSGDLVETTSYDAMGNVTGSTDVDGRRLSYTYDNHGLLASVTDGAGTTSYAYDLDDVLSAVTDGNGHTTTFVNDAAGRRVQKVLGTSTWTYAYDVSDNLVASTDPDGRTTAYTLDAADRRVGITHTQPGHPTIEIDQVFDGRGRRIGMTDPTGTHAFAYDDAGRLTSVVSPTGQFTYDYTTPGQRTTTYPDGTEVTHRYDDASRVMGVTAPGVDAAWTRDASGDITGLATGNGLFETYGYDSDGRLSSQELRCGTVDVMSTRYGYADDGSPLGTERVIDGQTTSTGFAYDGMRRLSAQHLEVDGGLVLPGAACVDGSTPPVVDPPDVPSGVPAPPTHVNDPLPTPGLADLAPAVEGPITYDAVGNRRSDDGVIHTYGVGDQLVSSTDGRHATYDGAGNLTSSTVDGATTTYGYDAAGRLVEVVRPDGVTVTYTLDGDGIRVGKALDGVHHTTYVWDRNADVALLVLELVASGDDRRFVYGVGPVALQTAGSTFYLHTDRQANVTAVSNGLGAMVAAYAYDAFGNSTATTSAGAPVNPLGFNSQYRDEDTGLYHLRAREYDPTVGRFTQPDPVVRPIGDPVVSPYIYADNQPTLLADASGLLALPIDHVGYSSENSDLAFVVRSGIAVGRFVGTKVLPAALKTATGTSIMASKYLGGSTRAALAATRDTAKFAKFAGYGLAAAGVGLSAWIVYEECTNGSTAQCVGASIGLAFNAGCLVVSGATATIACSLAGAGLQFVATNYGPDIAAFSVKRATTYADSQVSVSGVIGVALVAAVTAACAFVVTIGTVGVGTALCAAGGLLLGSYVWEVGAVIDRAIVSGFNDLTDALASGFDAAISVLGDAGLEAYALASMLVEQFSQDMVAVWGQLVGLGTEIEDLAVAIYGHFALAPGAMAAT